MDVDHFRTLLVENSCEKNEDRLMTGWFPQVTAMFTGDKALVSGPSRSRLYECVSTLIANQVSQYLIAEDMHTAGVCPHWSVVVVGTNHL